MARTPAAKRSQTRPNFSKPNQAGPKKTKKNQEKPRKNPWIFLDSFVRIRTFQWVTAIAKQKNSPLRCLSGT
jgi:hypothetical protein